MEKNSSSNFLGTQEFERCRPYIEAALQYAGGTHDIVDVYEEWPKTQEQLEEYVIEKYTSDKKDDTHHWETNEILLDDGTVFIKDGIEVTENWRTVMPDGTTKTKEESIYEVTNWEHEYFKNEEKRQILIPVSNMLEIMIEEFEDLVAYEPHNELDDANNKKTTLNIASRFLNNTGSVSFISLIESQVNNTGEVSFDDGPTLSASVGVATTTTTTTTTTPTPTPTPAPTPTPTPTPSPTPSPSPSDGGYGGGY